jgi:hypothetical protein
MPYIVYGYSREFPWHPHPKKRRQLQAQGKRFVLQCESHCATKAELREAEEELRGLGFHIEIEKFAPDDWPQETVHEQLMREIEDC